MRGRDETSPWEQVGLAVACLRGRSSNLSALLNELRGPIATDVKSALIAAVRPVPHYRKEVGWPVANPDLEAPRESFTVWRKTTFMVELRTRNGAPPAIVRQQNFIDGLSLPPRNLPLVLQSADIVSANRARFCLYLERYLESDPQVGAVLVEAFDPKGTSRYKLLIVPRVKRKRGRPPNRKEAELLGAQVVRARLDKNEEVAAGLRSFPTQELEAEASKKRLATRTLREKVQRLAPRKK